MSDHCADCKIALTLDERRYYENRCERCERILWGRLVDDDETTNEIDRLRKEVGRLKDIIRSCVHGAEIVDIGGECIGLHRPNKHCMADSSGVRALGGKS